MVDLKNVADFYKKIFIYEEDMFITFAMFYMIILGNNIRGIFTCGQINFFEVKVVHHLFHHILIHGKKYDLLRTRSFISTLHQIIVYFI